VAARCYAQLAPGAAAQEDGGGIVEVVSKDGDAGSVTVGGLGWGIELTERIIPRCALWTNFGADPMPASLVLGALLTYMGVSWTSFGTPSIDVYYDVRRMSVFDALKKVAELTGDHFRIGPGRELHWISSPSASGLWASGHLDAIAAESNSAVCAIASIKLTREAKALATRFYAYGGGDELYQVSLEGTTRASAPGYVPGTYTDSFYTLHVDGDPGACYLADSDAESFFGRIEKVLEVSDLVPLTRDLAGVRSASNALYDVTRDVLADTAYPQLYYEVELTGVQMQLYVGQTIHLDYHDFERTEDGTTNRYIDISDDVLILAIDVTHDEADLRDVRLEVIKTGVGAWPLSDADIVNAFVRRLKAATGVKQAPLRTDTFTMTATVTKTINDAEVTAASFIPLIPLNAAAVTRQAGAGRLDVIPGAGLFQVQTHDGISAAGTEQYRWQVIK
jgi:hypothetical protein